MVKLLITLESKATSLRLWTLNIHNIICICIYRYSIICVNTCKILSLYIKYINIKIYIYVFMHASLILSHDHAVQKVEKKLSSEGIWSPQA